MRGGPAQTPRCLPRPRVPQGLAELAAAAHRHLIALQGDTNKAALAAAAAAAGAGASPRPNQDTSAAPDQQLRFLPPGGPAAGGGVLPAQDGVAAVRALVERSVVELVTGIRSSPEVKVRVMRCAAGRACCAHWEPGTARHGCRLLHACAGLPAYVRPTPLCAFTHLCIRALIGQQQVHWLLSLHARATQPVGARGPAMTDCAGTAPVLHPYCTRTARPAGARGPAGCGLWPARRDGAAAAAAHHVPQRARGRAARRLLPRAGGHRCGRCTRPRTHACTRPALHAARMGPLRCAARRIAIATSASSPSRAPQCGASPSPSCGWVLTL